MLIDKLLEIFDALDMTSLAASTPVSLGEANAAGGQTIDFSVSAPAAAGTGPLLLTIATSATSGGTYVDIMTISLTTAMLAAGRTYKFSLPTPTTEFFRVTPTGTFSAGALDLAVVPDVQTNY